jgi:hypothetical protein
MNKILRISLFILLYLLFSAKSCSDARGPDDKPEEALLKSVKDSIRLEMEISGLSEADLKAGETVALQKLSDYSDYYKLLTDTTLDPSFRDKAREVAESLFMTGRLPDVAPVVDSARIQVPFHRVTDTTYAATLVLFPPPSPSGARTMGVFFLKRSKVFGTDTLKTWEVLLGDVK